MNWEDLERVNKEITTTPLKGKEYAEVKERVIAYRKLYPTGEIKTDLTFTENYVLCEAIVSDGQGMFIANGHARELLNKAFAVENAETSAIGRALGFMGIGISTSIASKEDMENVDSPSGIFDEPTDAQIKTLADEFRELYSKEEQVRILNGLKKIEAEQIGYVDLMKYVNFRKNEIKANESKGNQPKN